MPVRLISQLTLLRCRDVLPEMGIADRTPRSWRCTHAWQTLCRYAIAEGYMSANSPDERAASLSAALQRLKATNDWLDKERFMRPRVMRSWGHVVSLPASCDHQQPP